jgi:hypothetical protein
MSEIAIILIHYNSPVETMACLDSLQKISQKPYSWRIWILDNASKEVLTLPQRYKKMPITLIRSESNLGFTGGNNAVLQTILSQKETKPNYFLLLNSDTHVQADILETLVDYAKHHPQAGAITPKIYFTAHNEFHRNSYSENDRGSVLWYTGGVLDWSDVAAFHKNVDEVDHGQVAASGTCDFVTGCCVLIPATVLDKVGLLSEKLFLYWEDTEWSLRAQAAGYECHYCAETAIWHDNGGSTDGSGSETQVYYQTRNQLWMAFSYAPWSGKLAALRLLFKYVRGTIPQQQAVFDLFLGRMGKQVIV